MLVGDLIFQGDVSPLLPNGLPALGGGDEASPGDATPEHPLRPEVVGHIEGDIRRTPAGSVTELETAEAVRRKRDIVRHPRNDAGEPARPYPERTGPTEQRR